jgi:hypothetical protein
MKKGKGIHLAVGGLLCAITLTSCGRSVQRTEAIEILESIDDKVSSSSYSFPTSYTESVTYSGDGSMTYFVSYIANEYYYHDSWSGTRTILGVSWTGKTETYLYIDDGVLYSVDVTEKTYTKTSDSPISSFQKQVAEKTDANSIAIPDVPTQVNENAPQEVKSLLSSNGDVASDGETTEITAESYKTSTDEDLDAAFSLTKTSESTVSTQVYFFSFTANHLCEYDYTEDNVVSKTTYAWGNAKASKPDLSTFTNNDV